MNGVKIHFEFDFAEKNGIYYVYLCGFFLLFVCYSHFGLCFQKGIQKVFKRLKIYFI